MMKKALLDFSLEELKEEIKTIGEPAFRAKQIYGWLTAGVGFDGMTNLSLKLREKLKETYTEGFAEIVRVQVSSDGTKKYLLKMQDGNLVESVLMRYEHGNTICISTQAGCALGCRFCASTLGGLIRHLTAGEILSQVIAVNADEGSGRNITNVVMMGTGEPFHNYANSVKAVKLMHAPEGLGISARNISISTCGLPDGIRKFTEEGLPVTLCFSMHSAFEHKRKEIMPIANRYSLKEVLGAMREYQDKTGRRVIFEYLLIDEFNNLDEDVRELKQLTKGLICHINLIPYNHVEGAPYKAPTVGAVH
ncbi:MAG: 23S rRNA (adenine(2503)-C(2))-methyltransferase RlmN, partial [Christensenellaceae bacterium]|nr:23S rRNA (adenine(2503)-C(2))-methyltransferase RlmN [Christensenellaceae bacterium]